MNNDPVFSRSGAGSVFGKRTDKVSALVSTETKEALRALWRELGYESESEFVAHLIEIRVHGLEHVRSVHVDRLRAVAGIGEEKERT